MLPILIIQRRNLFVRLALAVEVSNIQSVVRDHIKGAVILFRYANDIIDFQIIS
jgi:hypothetical protein